MRSSASAWKSCHEYWLASLRVTRLPRAFFARPSPEVASDLLGKILVRESPDGLLSGRIVETEAYTGANDPGSHAYRGVTPRNRVMFGPPGHLYCYRSYGVHTCMNVVTDTEDVAGAVLVRALDPLDGIDSMKKHRGGRPLVELCNGPGKLCQALGITLDDNGADLETSGIWFEDDGYVPQEMAASARVGLSQGKDLPLRFYLPGNQFVSPGRPPVPA